MANREIQQEQAEEAAQQFGNEFVGWDVLEYRKYERGRAWYVIMLLLGLGLLIYSVLSANFLFALFIVMFSLMVYLTTVGNPRTMRFAVTETGIRLGNTHRSFRDVNRFWFVYQPPAVKALYIEFKSSLTPRMIVDLEDMNPNEVRAVMSRFTREDLNEDDEPFSDFLGRLLKL